MAALATAFVRLRVDTSRTKDDIERGLRGANPEKIAGQKGAASGQAFSKGFSQGSSTFGRVAATMAARATILTSGLVAATAASGKFVAAIAPATGILAGLVSATAAAGAVTKTYQIAVAGVSDAIGKGLYGNATAYGNALEDLSPTQQKITKQIVAMKDRIQDTREVISSRFFAPLLDDIEPLASTYLPLGAQQMGLLAEAMGGVANQIANTARSSLAVETVRSVFTETTGAVTGMELGVGRLTTSLLLLLRSSTPLIRVQAADLGTLVDNITNWANEAARTGKLVTWYRNARDTIADLYRIFANLGAITKAVMRPLIGDSQTFLNRLVALTDQARAFVESAKGGETLKDLFASLGVLGEAMRKALAGLLPEIGQSLKIAAPAAAALAAAVSRLLIALGPLLPALTQSAAVIATAFVPVLNALASVLERNQGLLRTIAPFIVAYVVAQKAAGAATAVATAAHWLHAKAVLFSKSTLGTFLGVKALEAGAWARSTAAIVANRVALIGHTVAMGAARVATIAWTVATNISAVAMRAAGVALRFMTGPIGIAITAIAAITLVLVKLYKENETFRKIVDSVWKAVKSAIKAVGDWITQTLWPSLKRAWDQLATLTRGLGRVIGEVWKFIKDQIEFRWNLIKAIFNAIRTFITVTLPGAFRAGRDAMTNAWRNLRDNINTVWTTIRGYFNAVRTFIMVTLPGAFRSGRDAITGAWRSMRDGISAGWNTVRGYFTSLMTAIKTNIPNAFRTGVDAIRKAWDAVRAAARKPVEFVVNSVMNPLIRGYNKIAGVFNAPTAKEIPGFHSGGKIPGAPSAVDNRIATVMDAGRRALGNIKVATGEFIVNAKSTAANLPLIQAINSAKGSIFGGGAKRVNGVNTAKDGLADGGLIGGFLDKVSSGIKGVGKFITDPVSGLKKLFDSAMGKIPGGGSIVNLLKGMGGRVFDGVKKFLSGAMFTGGGGGSFGKWPSSPGAQRGDSGVWRQVVAMIKSSGIKQGSFGNGYRPGDPKWHGSGRAVDWMGFNMDALATWLSQRRPLELIHRTRNRDYAYTRGKNQGSFNESLMNAHRNHIHIAMRRGGLIGRSIAESLGNSRVVKLLDRGGSWPSGTLGLNASGHTETVLTGGPNGDMAELRDLLKEQNRLLRGLAAGIAEALERPTRRAVQLGRSGASSAARG